MSIETVVQGGQREVSFSMHSRQRLPEPNQPSDELGEMIQRLLWLSRMIVPVRSFQSIGAAGPWTYSVKDSNSDGLLNLCISLGCRNDYPCSYTGQGSAGPNGLRVAMIVLITVLLLFAFWPCLYPIGSYVVDTSFKWIKDEI
eukprot:757416-Hanusia_phi.AAC.3